MTTLNDDCLLYLLDYLDPLSIASFARVCTRWKKIAERKLKKITEVHCCDDHQCDTAKLVQTTKAEMLSALEYLGPNIKLVKMGFCKKSIIFFRLGSVAYGYDVSQTDKPRSRYRLSKRENVAQDWWNFPQGVFDSVEEVIWKINTRFAGPPFILTFPVMNKLTLIVNESNGVDDKVYTILKHLQDIESSVRTLTVVFNNCFLSNMMGLLTYISAHVQLEELRIILKGNAKKLEKMYSNAVFPRDRVDKMIETSRNLQVIRFDVPIGNADVSSFFSLPKLRELYIPKARHFGSEVLHKIEQNEFPNMQKLEIQFDEEKLDRLLGLFEAVDKMPGLEYLKVDGLPEELAVLLTCKVMISEALRGKDIIIRIGEADEAMMVCRNSKTKPEPELLRLSIGLRGDNYVSEVEKFVKRLNHWSIVRDKVFVGDREEEKFNEKYSGMLKYCECAEQGYWSYLDQYNNIDL